MAPRRIGAALLGGRLAFASTAAAAAHALAKRVADMRILSLQGPGGPVGPKGEVSGWQGSHDKLRRARWLLGPALGHRPGPQHEPSLPCRPRGSSVGRQLRGPLPSDPRCPACAPRLAAEGSWARKASRAPTAPAARRACPAPRGPWASRACRACLASPGNPASRYVLSSPTSVWPWACLGVPARPQHADGPLG